MSVRLFVSDIDGTLLNRKQEIPEANKRAVQEAVNKGVVFTLATGRMYSAAVPFAKALGVDVPIITYNGAVIKTLSGKEIFTSYLDADIIHEMVTFAAERDLHLQSYSDDQLYYAKHTPQGEFYETAIGCKGHAVGNALYDVTQRVPKMLIVTKDPSVTDGIIEEIKAKFGGRILPAKSTPIYIELIKPGIDKAASIGKLAELMGIKPDEVLAIGDSNNDVPMVRAAAYGVAMANATPEVKAAADYEVCDCDEGGVAEALHRFCLDC